jgi:hypothetical protein
VGVRGLVVTAVNGASSNGGTRFRRRSSGTWTGPSSGRSSAAGDAPRAGVVDGGAAGDRMPAPGIPTEVMMTEASIGQGLEPTAAAVLPAGVRENAHLRQPRRAVLRGDRPDRGADRRLSHRPSPTWPSSTPRSPSTKRCTQEQTVLSFGEREADQGILLDLIGTIKEEWCSSWSGSRPTTRSASTGRRGSLGPRRRKYPCELPLI